MKLRVLRYTSKAVKAACVVDQNGSIGRIWIDRSWQNLRLGSKHAATLSERADGGGWFAKLPDKQNVYVTGAAARRGAVGNKGVVTIKSEAWEEKHARGHFVEDSASLDTSVSPAFEVFCRSLPGPYHIEDINPKYHGAWFLGELDAQRQASVMVSGGGRLNLFPTPAMTVIDVDRAGRACKGKAVPATHSLNMDAVTEAARVVARQSIGGLVVIDCVGTILPPSRGALSAQFKTAFMSLDTRKIETLPVSRLGLLQVSIERQFSPLNAWSETMEANLVKSIWSAEQALVSNPSHMFCLKLPRNLAKPLVDLVGELADALANSFGNRLEVKFADSGPSLIRKP